MLNTFLKPVHTHFEKHGACSEEHQPNSNSAEHDHHESETDSDCGNHCACPLHRINGCSSVTAITKNPRLILLTIPSPLEPDFLFLAKQSPDLDGPFQPPRI